MINVSFDKGGWMLKISHAFGSPFETTFFFLCFGKVCLFVYCMHAFALLFIEFYGEFYLISDKCQPFVFSQANKMQHCIYFFQV